MPWLVRKPPPHDRCNRPRTEDAGVGSVWQCDICEKKWQVTATTVDGQILTWKRLTFQFEDGDQTR
jgi:hypothetical protein